jgi:hypothetical protein
MQFRGQLLTVTLGQFLTVTTIPSSLQGQLLSRSPARYQKIQEAQLENLGFSFVLM